MIKENLARVLEKMDSAADKVGKKSKDIKLVAITKNVGIKEILEVLGAGIRDIGENRIQEAAKKYGDLVRLPTAEFSLHMVGHLQTNKVKKAVGIFGLIQSLDSVHLATEIDVEAKKNNKIQDCLVEVKISEEETKYGCQPENLYDLLEKTSNLNGIRICGLMAMAPFFEDPALTRPYFRRARRLFDEFEKMSDKTGDFKYISMGMSNDFETAIEEGSNMVRIGTAIFGEKNAKNN
ncbi:MAG: YggS family pyridoxal phosphate-dependent enzyme [Elusimicrobiota bacterium]